MKKFNYVGPTDLLALVGVNPKGKKIDLFLDVLSWIADTEQILGINNEIVATYIIDAEQHLLIADRRSEHVVCAGGKEVLAAGEVVFEINDDFVVVTEITNQSTGYCPELSSWKAIDVAMRRTGIAYPNGFGRVFEFRRCKNCGAINIVKDEWYVCAECSSDLPKSWNFD